MNNDTTDHRAIPRATGPRTDAGKAVSSQNARKHDLCSKALRLSPEEWVEYNGMRERYGGDLQPAGDIEENLVDEICFNYWRLQQAREIELDIILNHPTDPRIITLYIRYRTGYEHAFYKALDQIQKLQRDRRKQTAQAGAVRSAETRNATESEVHTAQVSPVPAAPVRSAESVSTKVPSAEQLSRRLDEFVSQNSEALPSQLLDLLKEVA